MTTITVDLIEGYRVTLAFGSIPLLLFLKKAHRKQGFYDNKDKI
jgi:hypothetical protein